MEKVLEKQKKKTKERTKNFKQGTRCGRYLTGWREDDGDKKTYGV